MHNIYIFKIAKLFIMTWANGRGGFRIYKKNISELDGGIENIISTLMSGDDPMLQDYIYKENIDSIDYLFSDLKIVKEITYGEYLRRRGVDVDEFRNQIYEGLKRKLKNESEQKLQDIIDSIMERQMKREHHVGIFRMGESVYFIMPNKDFENQINKILVRLNIAMQLYSINNFPDFLLWLVKKKYRNENIGTFTIEDISDIEGTEKFSGSYDDKHSSNGPELNLSLPAMYLLVRSEHVDDLGMKVTSYTQHVSMVVTLHSDFPANPNTFFATVLTINSEIPANLATFIRNSHEKYQNMPKSIKRVVYLSVMSEYFLGTAYEEYQKELNNWTTVEKDKFKKDISKQVNDDTK